MVMRMAIVFVFCIFLICGSSVSCFLFDLKKPVIVADIINECDNQPLDTIGTIPGWLSGTFVQNGPVKVTIDGKSNKSWFDGVGMLHAFTFDSGTVAYTNKFLKSKVYDIVFKDGSLEYQGFNSHISYFARFKLLCKRLISFITPYGTTNNTTNNNIQNANVNVAKIADAYVALTEVPLPVQFDLRTLDTMGNFVYQDSLPQKGCWESAHPYYDVNTKETLNYLIMFGKNSYYVCYRIRDGSSKREIIAQIPVQCPSYMHSFAVTKNYIIFTEFPLVVNPLDIMVKNQGYISNFNWKPERGTQFILVNRKTGVVNKYKTKPFFAFHHINAFEENNFVYLDMVTYDSASIVIGKSSLTGQLEKTELEKIDSVAENLSKIERFSLSLETGVIESFVICDKSVEFPAINSRYGTRPYRYMYAASFNQSKNNALYKINRITREVMIISKDGCVYGEPTFIPTPSKRFERTSGEFDEDDGVVIALVVDSMNNDSYLLFVDGKSFVEIGRAKAPHQIAHTLHGKFFGIQ